VFRVFIDGQAGTTGLEIKGRLRGRRELDLLEIDEAGRKDPVRRAELLNVADLVVLCLPDDAAREAVALVTNPRTKILDASTAFRTAPDWTYGLPELDPAQRRAIARARRVSNPGCYSTGFLLAVRPLVEAGLVPRNRTLTVHAVSGYSGGGRGMIERYRAAEARGVDGVLPPMTYGLERTHKHVPEMQCYAGVRMRPIFSPMVAHYYKGMLVHVPLDATLLGGAGASAVQRVLEARYADEPCVRVFPLGAKDALVDGYLSPTAANDTNRIDLMVFGDDSHALVVARLDNLGKGASGAAVQNLNLMLGLPELEGLVLESTA
jgi:N-acetyl-gamma-glutamyl-phosphate reductase